MTIIVHSNYPLSFTEKGWITGIFSESQNPNESLSKTFGERYHHMFEDEPVEVFLDSPDSQYKWEVEIERYL